MSGALLGTPVQKSVLIFLLFLLTSFSPMVNYQGGEIFDESPENPQSSSPFTLSSGDGHDFAGTVISFDGLESAVVREESALDYWANVELNNSSVEHHGVPDMKLTRHNSEHFCWSTEEGPVRTAVHTPGGYWSSMLVDNVTASHSTGLVDCAIAVTDNERPRVLYADGPDLKMGRYAAMSTNYWDGARWHTRTIFEDVNATHLEMDITPNGLEWGLMRTQDGALHQVNFSGNYWTKYLLDAGPVGTDIELEVDSNGVAHILYTRNTSGSVILLRIDGWEHESQILSQDASMSSALGMGLDANNIEQVATVLQGPSSFSIQLIRSLDGQDSGRINPTPSYTVTGEDDAIEGSMMMGDLNADGFADLIIATPTADLLGNTHNGRVDVYHGSSSGLSSIPDVILAGEGDLFHFGMGIDLGDFDGDGIQDLAVGVPGWYNLTQSEGQQGQVQIFTGHGDGLTSQPMYSMSGTGDERIGDVVNSLEQSGSHSALAVSAQGWGNGLSGTENKSGKVLVFGFETGSMILERNLTQTTNGKMFGRTMEACDINGDSFDELIVGNTGTYDDALSYSSIEYFEGSSNGYDGTPIHIVESNQQGRLFGHNIACLEDINGDGLEDHIISEPYNSSGGGFSAGKLWLYNGATGAMSSEPDWTLLSSEPNARIGGAIEAIGDLNDDGFGDVLISKLGGDSGGSLEIFLGSSTGLQAESQLLAEGLSGEYLGSVLAGYGDVNSDGLNEIIYSMRNTSEGTDFSLNYPVLSERDLEYLTFTYNGVLTGLDLGTATRGETSMAFTLSNNDGHKLMKLEHMKDGTPIGQWVEQCIVSSIDPSTQFIFDVRPSGMPIIVTEDNMHMVLHTPTSMTAVEMDVATTGTMGQFLGASLDADGQQMLAYTSGAGQQIFASQESASGWTHEMVRSAAALGGPISVSIDETGAPSLVYRLTTNQLELAQRPSGWSLTSLGLEGQAVSTQHPSLIMPDGKLAVALVTSDGNATNLSLWTYDGQQLETSWIANQSDLDVQISTALLSNGSLLVATLTSTGELSLFEQYPGSSEWESHSLAQPSGTVHEYRLDLTGGTEPVLAIRANSVSSLYMMNEDATWTSVAERPAAAVDGAWDILHMGSHLLLVTSEPVTQRVTINTLDLNSITNASASWLSVSFGGIESSAPMNAMVDSNNTVHLSYWDTSSDDVVVLRLYADQDRDLVFDLIDALPTVGNQWMDSDSDNYGDNPLGPLGDDCPTTPGSSGYYGLHGCPDYDFDGFADQIDDCGNDFGTSWIDRFGCEDADQDGWSDNGQGYIDGDKYPDNWKISLDSDGDTYGDNHGPDCCDTIFDPSVGDEFPYIASQYKDRDGDGFGDNDSDSVYGDFCPFVWGSSYLDRNGCLDTDGDGASDPSDIGNSLEWNESMGADMWPTDPTQWADSDGDGFGDNGSMNATNPDSFPNNIAVANDSDQDGYPDEWTEFYNATMDDDGDGIENAFDWCGGSIVNSTEQVDSEGCNEFDSRPQVRAPPELNNQGLTLDGCPGEWGNSTKPAGGCLDSDGDSWSDNIDEFPLEPTQWADLDGDGFGDQINGFQGDVCPAEVGVLNGTAGVGCRFIDLADQDLDGVINQDDACAETPAGQSVNDQGCAESQLDDDADGVANNVDLCADTAASATVDNDGCSATQRESDSDGDGLNDPEDSCPGTDADAVVDANGCSEAQRDSDGDGISDLSDVCDDTPAGFPILANGCTDEDALDTDLDGDGYSGAYSYNIDAETGLRYDEQGDAYPTDGTQWSDQDGDGFGDNSSGTNGDDCPAEYGTSFEDYLGCADDGDGWRDEFEPVNLRNDATQWQDSDFDGFGDNWGDSSWNSSRNPTWPGIFVEGATNADLCPKTLYQLKDQVDGEGCHITERDSDGDGVYDNEDECVDKPKGSDGYADGCPYEPLSNGNEDDGLLGMSGGTLMIALSGIGMLVIVVFLVILRASSREDDDEDEDDDYDDFMDDDDDSDDVFKSLDRKSAAASTRTASAGPSRSKQTERKGPTSSPVQRSAPSQQKQSSGPPGRSPPSRGPPGAKKEVQKVAKKKSVSAQEEPSAKVRKAKISVDLSIFEDWQTDDRESAVDWVVEAVGDGELERGILMQLQETGWSAEQSRAIFNLARNR